MKQSFSGVHVFVLSPTSKEAPSLSNGRFDRFTMAMDSAILTAEFFPLDVNQNKGEISIPRSQTTQNEQHVLILSKTPAGKLVCYPAWEKNRGFKLQFGGSFVWSNRADFRKVSEHPIPVFDKINEDETGKESAPVI